MVFTFTGSFALTMRSSESQLTPKTLLYLPAGEAHSNIFGSQGAGVFVTSIDPAWIGDRLETVSARMERPRIAPAGSLSGLALKIYREFRNPGHWRVPTQAAGGVCSPATRVHRKR